MQLSESAITSLKELYLKHFGVILSTEEAHQRGLELLQLFKLIYRPIPKTNSWMVNPVVPVYEIE